MKLILTAVEKSLADAWQKFCGDLDFMTVHQGSILVKDLSFGKSGCNIARCASAGIVR